LVTAEPQRLLGTFRQFRSSVNILFSVLHLEIPRNGSPRRLGPDRID
jgi:hypothetical protein